MPPQKSVCLFMNNGLLYEHNFMKDGFLGFAGMGSRTGLLPPLSERLTHAIKRLADQHRGLFLADPLVGTLRAPRRLPGEETRLPLASGRLAVIIQRTLQCSFGLLFQAQLLFPPEVLTIVTHVITHSSCA